MKFIYRFDRDRPFADAFPGGTPDETVSAYEAELAAHFRERYPWHEVVVEHVVGEPGDVEFVPVTAMPEATQLETALEMRRDAHRLAQRMSAELLARAAHDAD